MRKDFSVAKPITDTLQILQEYSSANSKRRLMRNKLRTTLFQTVMREIEEIGNQRESSVLDVLTEIHRKLMLAQTDNNALDSTRNEHQGLSSNALTKAIENIASVIVIEKRVVAAEVRAADIRRMAGIHEQALVAANARVIEALNAKILEVEDAASAALLEAGEVNARIRETYEAREAETARDMRVLQTEVARQKEEVRFKEVAEREMRAVIVDPIAFVAGEIRDGRVKELDQVNIIARIEALAAEHPERLTPIQEAFYRALRTEFSDRKLSIGAGILSLIVRSPLADRYAEKAENTLALRKMIQTIGNIVQLCLNNSNGALQDLHHLFIAQNEEALHDMLSLLLRKKMLVLKPVASSQDTVTHDDFARAVSAALNPVLMSKPLNMNVVDEAVLSAREVMASHVASVSLAGARVIQAVPTINEAVRALYHAVKLSSLISVLTSDITVNTQKLIAATQEAGANLHHEALERVGENLSPALSLLNALAVLMEKNKEALRVIFSDLDSAYQREIQDKSKRVDLALKEKMELLFSDYDIWSRDYKNAQQTLDVVLAEVGSVFELSPLDQVAVADKLMPANQKAKEARHFQEKIRDDIAKVKAELLGHIKATCVLPPVTLADRITAQDEQGQVLSFAFLLSRTQDYNARNLSYKNVLHAWQENPEGCQYFDDYSRAILGRYPIAEYEGVRQINVFVTNSNVQTGKPPIDNTDAALWSLTCASVNPLPVDFDELTVESASRMHLTAEDRFLLPLLHAVIQSKGIAFCDDPKNPSFVVLLEGMKLDWVLYLAFKDLHEKFSALNNLISDAKKYHAELVERGVISASFFDVDLESSVESDAKHLEPLSVVALNEKVALLAALVNQIMHTKSELIHVATMHAAKAFEVPVSASQGMQRRGSTVVELFQQNHSSRHEKETVVRRQRSLSV